MRTSSIFAVVLAFVTPAVFAAALKPMASRDIDLKFDDAPAPPAAPIVNRIIFVNEEPEDTR
ncbi:hypothetical protein HGRIS_006058 [Hohenbuehelia grisea]|uniref:Uncharacterized protein n=1 Tax=Hohenbuehelia grisea TaxID=104357 RepID=A0ABR3K101_9AGAR